MALQIKLFGHFEVWLEGRLVDSWPRQKTQELLQLLLSERGCTFSPDQLIEILFPSLDPEKAINNLQKRISELRHTLEPHLARGADSLFILHSGSREQGYYFNPDTECHLDLEAFDKSIQLAQVASASERWTQAIEHYNRAIALYRDDFLSDFLYEEWTIAPRERWREKFLQALAHLAESHARVGQLHLAIECCDRVLTHQPWSEPLYRQKMLYCYHSANRAKALDTFKECSAMLRKHLDADPSPETVALREQILKYQVAPLPRAIPNNLPQSLTSFVGREREMVELNQLLMHTRLLTLAGVGGGGKTRLALQTATQQLKEFSDGVWWVELASLSDPNLVVQTLASAMGVQEQAKKSLLSTVCESLHSKKALVVLDNCEHLLGACAELAQELLKSCPKVQMIATSREPLGILGEKIWQVPPLSVPQPNEEELSIQKLQEYEAACLFEERARANDSTFELTKENIQAVAQICHRLDGLPLALELAAARVRALSVQQIASRLDDRFKLLTGGNRGSLPRHQTLQAAMEWSYQLLTEKERGLLRRVSVFSGGWTLEAAEQICANELILSEEVMELLTHLVDKSLVSTEKGKEETRYKLLETVRQYASVKLSEGGEADKVRERHLDFYLKLAEEAEPELVGPRQKEWLDRLEREHDNLRGAIGLTYEEEGLIRQGLHLSIALGHFWRIRGYWKEGHEIFLRFSNKPLWLPSDQWKILAWIGCLSRLQGSNVEAKEFLSQSLAIKCEKRGKDIIFILNNLGMAIYKEGNFPEAKILFEKSLSLAQENSDRYGEASVLINLGNILREQGNYKAAYALLEQALEVSRKIRDEQSIAASLSNLGIIANNQRDYINARRYFEESLDIMKHLGDQQGIARLLNNMGILANDQNDFLRAQNLLRKSLEIKRVLRDQQGIAHTLANLGISATQQGDLFSAQNFFEEALAIRKQTRDKGRIAFLLTNLGIISEKKGDQLAARNLFVKSLFMQKEVGDKYNLCQTLEEIAKSFNNQGKFGKGALLLGAIETLHKCIGSSMPAGNLFDFNNHITALRSSLGEEAFEKYWAEGRAMSMEQAIEYALSEIDENLSLESLTNQLDSQG